MIAIVPLQRDHLEDASNLVGKQYQDLREDVPDLPGRYSQRDAFLPLLENIIQAGSPGVAALENSKLVGFLTGWRLPSFRGDRSIYSPEWGNAADPANSSRIYEDMYRELAKTWLDEKYGAHYISLFPNNPDVLKCWHWMGFGMISVDGIRGVDPIMEFNPKIKVRKANIEDINIVVGLHEDLRTYMMESPIFLPRDKQDQAYFTDWLKDPDKSVWLGLHHDKPSAFMRLGPADEDVCTIILDEGTTSIYAAYIKEGCRNEGLGASLLNQSLSSARSSGYRICAVTFEPMNIIGTRFWLKYFTPVCYSMLRHLDTRMIQSKPSEN